MNTADVLQRVRDLGGRLEARGDRLHVEAADPLPELLVEELRQHKPAIMAALATPKSSGPEVLGYRQEHQGAQTEGEIEEVITTVQRDGFALLWSTVVGDLVAFCGTDADRTRIPPGFVIYTEDELFHLFGDPAHKLSERQLRLIHAAKKLAGARVTGRGDAP